MRSPYPCLWFDGVAEEAAEFYVSLFPDSRIDKVWRSPADTPSGPAGMVLTVDFTIDGRPFRALNGGPQFHISEAISIVIECDDQPEVDRLWGAITAAGGEPGPCGWIKDRFGRPTGRERWPSGGAPEGILHADAVEVGAVVEIFGQHHRTPEGTTSLQDGRVPVGDAEAAPCPERPSHHLDTRDLHRKPTPGLDQAGCLVVCDRVRPTRSGGLDVELLEDLDRQADVPCSEDLVRKGGLGAFRGVPGDGVQQDVRVNEAHGRGPHRAPGGLPHGSA